jgi:hypothetical protein
MYQSINTNREKIQEVLVQPGRITTIKYKNILNE